MASDARFIRAADIQQGMTLVVPGAELHEDLAGLEVHLSAHAVEREDGKTRVFDKFSETWTTWTDHEEVRRG